MELAAAQGVCFVSCTSAAGLSGRGQVPGLVLPALGLYLRERTGSWRPLFSVVGVIVALSGLGPPPRARPSQNSGSSFTSSAV